MKVDEQEKLIDVQEAYEWKKWAQEIPYIHWPSDWQVKAVPPFSTGIIRYWIRTHKMLSNAIVSVYLDCYDRAGYVGEPYWEVYPVGGDCHRCLMADTAKLLKLISLSIVEQEHSFQALISRGEA